MLKFIRNLLFVFAIMVIASCKAPQDANVAPGEGGTTTAITNANARYIYIGKMYSEVSGSTYKSAALSGPVFEAFRGKIEKILNGMLRFPLTDTATALKSKKTRDYIAENLARSTIILGSININFFNIFKKLNSNILAQSGTTSFNEDYNHPNNVHVPGGTPLVAGHDYFMQLADQLSKFASSSTGHQITAAMTDIDFSGEDQIKTYLSNYLSQPKNVASVVSAVCELLSKVVGSSKGGQAVIGALGAGAKGFISGGPVGALFSIGKSLWASIFGGTSETTQILEKVKLIYEIVQRIETKINELNYKADQLLNATYAQQMRDAKTPIDNINTALFASMSSVASYAGNPAGLINAVKILFDTNIFDYNFRMHAGLSALLNYQDRYREFADTPINAADKRSRLNTDKIRVEMKGIVFEPYDKYQRLVYPAEGVPYYEEAPVWRKSKALMKPTKLYDYLKTRVPDVMYCLNGVFDHIMSMRRYSVERLKMLAYAYSGTELLIKRRDFAQSDLNSFLQIIKNDFNRLPELIKNHIINHNLVNQAAMDSLSYKAPLIYRPATPQLGIIAGIVSRDIGLARPVFDSFLSEPPIQDNMREGIEITLTFAGQWSYWAENTNPSIYEIKLVNEYTGKEYVFSPTDSSSINAVVEFLRDYVLYHPDAADYIALMASMIAGWEIELRAHIDAGAGL